MDGAYGATWLPEHGLKEHDTTAGPSPGLDGRQPGNPHPPELHGRNERQTSAKGGETTSWGTEVLWVSITFQSHLPSKAKVRHTRFFPQLILSLLDIDD